MRPVRSTPSSASSSSGCLPAKLVPDGADLQDHDADGVGDDVVELPRDPRAFLGDRDAGGRLPLPLGLQRPHLRCLGLLGPPTHGEAGGPADREQEGDGDQLAGRVAGVVVGDDHGPGEDDRQAEPGLGGVAEVAEQERCCEPGDQCAGREGDEPAVDE